MIFGAGIPAADVPILATGKHCRPWVLYGTILEASTDEEGLWIQEPSLMCDTDPQILTGLPHVFKLWYSSGVNFHIGYAESPDCINWTKRSSAVIANGTRCGNVLRVGAYYYLTMFEPFGTIRLMRSTDGIAWINVSTVATPGGEGAWNQSLSGNSCLLVDGDAWYCFVDTVDGRGAFPGYVVGLYVSPDAGATWSEGSFTNPVLDHPQFGVDVGGTISGMFVKKVGATFYMWAQGSLASAYGPTDILRFSSTDLQTWTQAPVAFTFPRHRPANNGIDTVDRAYLSQVADVTMAEVDGKTYMVYSGLQDATADSHFELAVADMTIADLVQTDEGIQLGANPELMVNASFEGVDYGEGTNACFTWADTVSDGAIARTKTAAEVHTDTSRIAAIKLTAGEGTDTNTVQAKHGLVPSCHYTLSGWARGDGTNAGRVAVTDSTGGVLLAVTALGTGATYAAFSETFVAPTNGIANIILLCPETEGGYVCFDDISLKRTL